MPLIQQSNLAEYVVKETLRQIRNGQVRLKKLGIECEPELEVQFQVQVLIPGGLNAIQRSTAGTQTQTQDVGERGASQKSEQTTTGTDTQEQVFGRSNETTLAYES